MSDVGRQKGKRLLSVCVGVGLEEEEVALFDCSSRTLLSSKYLSC